MSERDRLIKDILEEILAINKNILATTKLYSLKLDELVDAINNLVSSRQTIKKPYVNPDENIQAPPIIDFDWTGDFDKFSGLGGLEPDIKVDIQAVQTDTEVMVKTVGGYIPKPKWDLINGELFTRGFKWQSRQGSPGFWLLTRPQKRFDFPSSVK